MPGVVEYWDGWTLLGGIQGQLLQPDPPQRFILRVLISVISRRGPCLDPQSGLHTAWPMGQVDPQGAEEAVWGTQLSAVTFSATLPGKAEDREWVQRGWSTGIGAAGAFIALGMVSPLQDSESSPQRPCRGAARPRCS